MISISSDPVGNRMASVLSVEVVVSSWFTSSSSTKTKYWSSWSSSRSASIIVLGIVIVNRPSSVAVMPMAIALYSALGAMLCRTPPVISNVMRSSVPLLTLCCPSCWCLLRICRACLPLRILQTRTPRNQATACPGAPPECAMPGITGGSPSSTTISIPVASSIPSGISGYDVGSATSCAYRNSAATATPVPNSIIQGFFKTYNLGV